MVWYDKLSRLKQTLIDHALTFPLLVFLLQLVLFGLSNQVVVTFKEENTMTFKHLFLKNYDESSDDSFAVYTQESVYEYMLYAVDQVRREGHSHMETHLLFILKWHHIVLTL